MANLYRRPHEEDDDDLYGSQMSELDSAFMAQSDFDLAYRLQLEEALRASREEQQQGPSDLTHVADSPEDRSLAFSFQNLELSRSRQQAADFHRMTQESERLHQELRLRAHDAKFAQTLNELNDSDWDSHGDLCEDPFEADRKDNNPPTFKVYVSSVVSSENAFVSAAVGAVVMDSHDIVMTEIRKPLDSAVGKAAADYMALIAGMEALVVMRMLHVDAFIDSVLVYNQVTRRWKVRSRRLQVLCTQVMELARKFEQFHANLVPRSENSHALRLAREALHLQPASETQESTEAAEAKEFCPICLEGKKKDEMLQVSGCLHSFCLSCIVQHAEVKVQAGQVPVRCPHVSCSQTLSLSQCQSILSQKWFDLLSKRLIEVNMPEADRVYCPFPKCSALMNRKDLLASNDVASSSAMLSTVTPSRCMECFRLFCVECRVPWHTSMSCQQYQKLPPNLRDAQDANLYQLAEHQKWQRCKKCCRMIELAEGCYHMTCRCGYEFCYLCGEPWKNKSQSCRCRLWDEDFLLEEPLDEFGDDDDEWEGSEGYSEEFDDDYEDSEDFNDLNTS
ncbi:hypothetical protein GOP47_0019114, partial [Adiantum capillus-veneris]